MFIGSLLNDIITQQKHTHHFCNGPQEKAEVP